MKIGSKAWQGLIIKGAKLLDVYIDEQHTQQFASHAQELIQWNKRINLTRITDPGDLAIKHYIDSIAPAKEMGMGMTLLDIGSGGGFPGIPLKIINPSLSVTLIDASRKKANFLKYLIQKLKIEEISAIHARAEEFANELAFANRFDVIISRALADLNIFVNTAMPLLAPGGKMVALKGKYSRNEINLLNPTIEKDSLSLQIKSYILPFLEAERSMVIIRKINAGW